jgi:hypothetical protein
MFPPPKVTKPAIRAITATAQRMTSQRGTKISVGLTAE